MMALIDNTLSYFDEFRTHCDGLDYTGTVNPVDGVLYPGISTEIPKGVERKVVKSLQENIPKTINETVMFLRATLEGVPVPHQAHNDATMGDYGIILYLNRAEHCKGGTAFVRHIETGMDKNPRNQEEQEIWERDTNNREAWEIQEMVEMQPNRAFVFDTHSMHRAEMPTSFGADSTDGRLVLVCFARVI